MARLVGRRQYSPRQLADWPAQMGWFGAGYARRFAAGPLSVRQPICLSGVRVPDFVVAFGPFFVSACSAKTILAVTISTANRLKNISKRVAWYFPESLGLI